MFKQLSLLAGAAAIVLTGYAMLPAQAEGNHNAKAMAATETAPAPIEVRVCPIMHGMTVKGNGAGSEVVGKYKVYFCCKGCPEAFDKLTPAQKLQKAEEAYLIQQHNAEKKK
jgi:hypothetical protein